MKINIDGIEYEIDVEKAKALGVLKAPKVSKFEVGDILWYGSRVFGIIVQAEYNRDAYVIIGNNNSMSLYSNRAKTYKEMIQYLNEGKMPKIVGNINHIIGNYFKELLNQLSKE